MIYQAIKLPEFWIIITGDDFHNKNLRENDWAYHRGTKSIGCVISFFPETSSWSFRSKLYTTHRDNYKLFKIIAQSAPILSDIPVFEIPEGLNPINCEKYRVELEMSHDGKVDILSFENNFYYLGIRPEFTHFASTNLYPSVMPVTNKKIIVVGNGGFGIGSSSSEIINKIRMSNSDIPIAEVNKNHLVISNLKIPEKKIDLIKPFIPLIEDKNNYIDGKKLPKKRKKNNNECILF